MILITSLDRLARYAGYRYFFVQIIRGGDISSHPLRIFLEQKKHATSVMKPRLGAVKGLE